MFNSSIFLGVTAEDAALQKQKQDEITEAPFTYLQKIVNAAYRMKICQAFNHWIRTPVEKLNLIQEIQELLYMSFLMMDDIQDNSTQRRNSPAAHCLYGIPRTINASAICYFKAEEKVHSLDHPDAYRVFIEEIKILFRSEGIDTYWKEYHSIPNESEYKVIAASKSALNVSLYIRLMQLFSKNKQDFSKLVCMLALYHQILDDLCDIEEDITEGKLGFPIVHAINKLDNNEELLKILKERTCYPEMKKHCISLLEKCGSFQYGKETLQALEKQIRKETARLGPNPNFEGLLNKLFTAKRSAA